jgi:hypothetical protein
VIYAVVGVANESRHTGGVTHRRPRVFVEDHTNQNIGGNANARDELALTVLDVDDVLERHGYLKDVVLHVHREHAVLDVGLDLLLVTRIRVNDVPVAGFASKFLFEVRVGVFFWLGRRLRNTVVFCGVGGFVGFVVCRFIRGDRFGSRIDVESVVNDCIRLGLNCSSREVNVVKMVFGHVD